MADQDEVTLWKAPQRSRDAAAEVAAGFDPREYPGDGPYFALDLELAKDWEKIYQNGIQAVHIPRRLYEDLVNRQVIVPDSYCPGRSCHVPPVGLAAFNEAIRQGTTGTYGPHME